MIKVTFRIRTWSNVKRRTNMTIRAVAGDGVNMYMKKVALSIHSRDFGGLEVEVRDVQGTT